MIAMLDKDNSGGLGFDEFKSLWVALRQWRVSDTWSTKLQVYKLQVSTGENLVEVRLWKFIH